MRAKRSPWRVFLGVALVTFLGSIFLDFQVCSRVPFTCAVCRADKVERCCFGWKWSDQEESDCSRWYASHVESTHEHSWLEGTHCRRFGIPYLGGGYACRGGSPITMFSKSAQIRIYEHFDDRLEAKRLFLRLGQARPDRNRQWAALMKWMDAGYPDNWHDWWDEHRADAE